MAEPLTFQKFVSAGGAHVFRLPLELFPGFYGSAYLVMVDGYRVLVDAGSGNDISNEDLLSGFEQVGSVLQEKVGLEDLTHILITHGHIDHYGGLVFLRGKTTAQVGVHELDLTTLTRHEERLSLLSARLDKFLVQAGLEDETRSQLLSTYKFTKAIYCSGSVDFTFEESGMRLGPIEFLHIPGHCPGHVALRMHDFIFCGDQVLENMITHQSPENLISYSGLGHYLASLTQLEHWADEARFVFAGHGREIDDLPGRVRHIRSAIEAKLHSVMNYLAQPHTLVELTGYLYGEQAGYNSLLVIEKTGAFVEYLYQRGLLEITNPDCLESSGSSTPILYRRILNGTNSENVQEERAYVLI